MQPFETPQLQPVPSTVNAQILTTPTGEKTFVFTIADVTGTKTEFWPLEFAKQVGQLITDTVAQAGGIIVARGLPPVNGHVNGQQR